MTAPTPAGKQVGARNEESHLIRRPEHRKNPRLEMALRDLNEHLAHAEASHAGAAEPTLPVVVVLGPPRCGSTLAMQWLASSGAFAVPTNFMSRMPAAPGIAASLQRILRDEALQHGDEFADLPVATDWTSVLGKTRGAFAPNEFWYWWRQFLPTTSPRELAEAELDQADWVGLRRSLASWQAADPRPTALKGHYVAMNLARFCHEVPTAICLHITRDPVANAASILRARREHAGDVEEWYSIQPPGIAELRSLAPARQAVEQVVRVNRQIAAEAPSDSTVRTSYADLCRAPAEVWDALRARAQADGADIGAYSGPDAFEERQSAGDPAELAALRAALAETSL